MRGPAPCEVFGFPPFGHGPWGPFRPPMGGDMFGPFRHDGPHGPPGLGLGPHHYPFGHRFPGHHGFGHGPHGFGHGPHGFGHGPHGFGHHGHKRHHCEPRGPPGPGFPHDRAGPEQMDEPHECHRPPRPCCGSERRHCRRQPYRKCDRPRYSKSCKRPGNCCESSSSDSESSACENETCQHVTVTEVCS